ncbi:MAG: transcription-repair coupling factor [Chloroflexota bacterium]|nr:transcription-repair coupling factor [Chloroflexota bacterium]
MSFSHLLPELQRHPAIAKLAGATDLAIADLPDSARPAVIAAAVAAVPSVSLVVTSRADRAEELWAGMNEFLPAHRQARLWPAPDGIPYEQLPLDLDQSGMRVALLAQLSESSDTADGMILVVPAQALTQLVMSPEDLRQQSRTLVEGARLSIESLLSWAITVGYRTEPLVQEPGTIARRGGILDIYPPSADKPIRLDFFGDEIDTIRSFDAHSQRSDARLRKVTLHPPAELPLWRLAGIASALDALEIGTLRPEVVSEWRNQQERVSAGQVPAAVDLLAGFLVPDRSNLLDHLPKDAQVIIDHPQSIGLTLEQLTAQAEELLSGFVANGELPPGIEPPLLRPDEIASKVARFRQARIGTESTDHDDGAIAADGIHNPPVFAGRLDDLAESLRAKIATGWRISIATDQVDRVTELLEAREVYPRKEKRRQGGEAWPLPAGSVEVRASDLPSGWSWDEGRIAVWTDLELFGLRKRTRRGGSRSAATSIAFAQSLTAGEYVVHVDHGVARFEGLVRLETGGVEREYLLLEYERGDKLYVPVDQSDRVSRYSGGGIDPARNRLGSGDWIRVKRRVKRAVREMAFELIQLYARREASTGIGFPPDTHWDAELAESFPYVETPDQDAAIHAVKSDMEQPLPMDRLVCGDVGFGKTEVAIRAAFKAVNSGRQVAVLVPTTVLALQHFSTFRQRLAAFPVRIDMLSRLRSRRDQQSTLDGLKDGNVDIVIGTHRLVQRDVIFKDLGLVVVDEEQRFGVRQKEFLKQLKSEVDVLSMSATPIPRTLHMSLAGIRDISMIETAPQARLPIRTFVTAFTDQLVREVILRELDRGGQVYVVHNRVHDIDRLADRIRTAVPEARIGIGHGQMDERVLEEVMLAFVRNEFDVLISTTIIESGVDIPNVNTIIIDNADTLGLTQLYQLRGRVGRATNRAYAYLLYQPRKVLRREARERLETIQEATELGAGLRVAMRDLEIRGAGNILGAEQSGHIGAVGYDLYMRLLSQAVEEIRSGAPVAEVAPVTLDLPLTALIPETYIADTELRLATYRRIAAVSTLAGIDEMRDELVDRFGDAPDEVERLFALIRLRIRCEALGIESVVERERQIVIRPVPSTMLDSNRLHRRLGSAARVLPTSVRIRLLELAIPWEQALDMVFEEIEAATQTRSGHAAD